ncbi:MAG: signal transduction protein [Pseudomonas sp.]|nr:signal transduction protein [Pseudomonas sp.]
MTDRPSTLHSTASSTSSPTLQPILARQPILDRSLKVVAYELLCRPVPQDTEAWQNANGCHATTEVVIGAVHEIGLNIVTGNKPAFVNFTEEWLHRAPPMPPEDMVVEILEHIPRTPEAEAAVLALRQAGYRIAVDDFTGNCDQAQWFDLADVVKLDLLGVQDIQQAFALREKYHRPGLTWLAEKVETYDEFNTLAQAGFDLFQGFFYSKPTPVYGKRSPDSQMAVMQLLGTLNQSDAGPKDVSQCISNDPQLSFRLMQMANSASVNPGAAVTTLQRATALLGLTRIRQWANLLALGKLSDKPAVLQQQALYRAHLCQEISEAMPSHSMDPDTAFTLGLFSLLDAMMDTPINELCARLQLPEELSSALTQHQGQYGRLLQAVEAWEQATPESIPWSQLGLTSPEMEGAIERALVAMNRSAGLLNG